MALHKVIKELKFWIKVIFIGHHALGRETSQSQAKKAFFNNIPALSERSYHHVVLNKEIIRVKDSEKYLFHLLSDDLLLLICQYLDCKSLVCFSEVCSVLFHVSHHNLLWVSWLMLERNLFGAAVQQVAQSAGVTVPAAAANALVPAAVLPVALAGGVAPAAAVAPAVAAILPAADARNDGQTPEYIRQLFEQFCVFYRPSKEELLYYQYHFKRILAGADGRAEGGSVPEFDAPDNITTWMNDYKNGYRRNVDGRESNAAENMGDADALATEQINAEEEPSLGSIDLEDVIEPHNQNYEDDLDLELDIISDAVAARAQRQPQQVNLQSASQTHYPAFLQPIPTSPVLENTIQDEKIGELSLVSPAAASIPRISSLDSLALPGSVVPSAPSNAASGTGRRRAATIDHSPTLGPRLSLTSAATPIPTSVGNQVHLPSSPNSPDGSSPRLSLPSYNRSFSQILLQARSGSSKPLLVQASELQQYPSDAKNADGKHRASQYAADAIEVSEVSVFCDDSAVSVIGKSMPSTPRVASPANIPKVASQQVLSPDASEVSISAVSTKHVSFQHSAHAGTARIPDGNMLSSLSLPGAIAVLTALGSGAQAQINLQKSSRLSARSPRPVAVQGNEFSMTEEEKVICRKIREEYCRAYVIFRRRKLRNPCIRSRLMKAFVHEQKRKYLPITKWINHAKFVAFAFGYIWVILHALTLDGFFSVPEYLTYVLLLLSTLMSLLINLIVWTPTLYWPLALFRAVSKDIVGCWTSWAYALSVRGRFLQLACGSMLFVVPIIGFFVVLFPVYLPAWVPLIVALVSCLIQLYTTTQFVYPPAKRGYPWLIAFFLVFVDIYLAFMVVRLLFLDNLVRTLPWWIISAAPLVFACLPLSIFQMRLHIELNAMVARHGLCVCWNFSFIILLMLLVSSLVLVSLLLDGIIPMPFILALCPALLVGFIALCYYYSRAFHPKIIKQPAFKNPFTALFSGGVRNNTDAELYIV